MAPKRQSAAGRCAESQAGRQVCSVGASERIIAATRIAALIIIAEAVGMMVGRARRWRNQPKRRALRAR